MLLALLETTLVLGLMAYALAPLLVIGLGDSPPFATTQPTSHPVISEDNIAPEAVALLEKLEQVPKQIPYIEARVVVTYTSVDPVPNANQKTGAMALDFSTLPPRFRLEFTSMTLESKRTDLSLVFAFDGKWFYEFDGTRKSLRKSQYVGSKIRTDPFLLGGGGPFLMPFGNKIADVLRFLKVSPIEGLDSSTAGLLLIPKDDDGLGSRFIRMELLVDRRTSLPRTIKYAKESFNEIIVIELSEYTFEKKRGDRAYSVVAGPGVSESITPLESTEPAASRQGGK